MTTLEIVLVVVILALLFVFFVLGKALGNALDWTFAHFLRALFPGSK